MRNLTAAAICALSLPSVAFSAPGISPIGEAEGVSIRTSSAFDMSRSPRPLPRPDFDALKAAAEAAAKGMDVSNFPSVERLLTGKGFRIAEMSPPPVGIDQVPFAMSSEADLPSWGIFGIVKAPAAVVAHVSTPIEDATIGRLMNRYSSDGLSVEDDSHFERLFMIADGKRPSRIDNDGGVSFVSEAYEIPVPDPVTPQNYATPPQSTVHSQQAISNEQLAAFIMAMANRPQTPTGYIMPQPSPVQVQSATPLAGVPDLDYRGDTIPENAFLSASDIPSGSSPFSPEVLTGQPYPGQVAIPPQIAQMAQYAPVAVQPQNSIIGDGGNILLAGWKVGLTGSGGVGLYIEGDPGSIVEISEGMVVGSLGSVESISFQNGEIIASFTSGESLRGPARIVMTPSVGVSGSQGDSDRMISG